MQWNEQRNQMHSLISSLNEENADVSSIASDLSNLLNENPDEIASLEKTQSQLTNANTRLEEVRKTNRDLLSRISATTKPDDNKDEKITVDDILKGVL